MTKIYWLYNENGGGWGAWETKEQAEQALQSELIKHSTCKNWEVREFDADYCKTCGKIERVDNLEAFGECLGCEKMRGDFIIETQGENYEEE